jgi:hypothetical protein
MGQRPKFLALLLALVATLAATPLARARGGHFGEVSPVIGWPPQQEPTRDSDQNLTTTM